VRVTLRYRNDKDRAFSMPNVKALSPPGGDHPICYLIQMEDGHVICIENTAVQEVGTEDDPKEPTGA
jgi:hypothetical protein